MAIEYLGLSEINGPLVVLEGVKKDVYKRQENIGTNISDHGRCSCAGRTPAQYKDHDRIQNNVYNCAKYRTNHRSRRKSFCS